MTPWQYADASSRVVIRTLDDGSLESCLVTRADVQAWIAAGNTVLPAQSSFPYLTGGAMREERIVKRLAATDPIAALKRKEGW